MGFVELFRMTNWYCIPFKPKNVYKDLDDGRQRFLLELEFVQCLANPTYIHCKLFHSLLLTLSNVVLHRVIAASTALLTLKLGFLFISNWKKGVEGVTMVDVIFPFVCDCNLY